MQDTLTETTEVNTSIKKINKFKKIFGVVSVITGITMITIGLVVSGGSIIIPILGGYIIANGIVNIIIKNKHC